MGLSAGQAKLLSLTARITDNEYKSQNLANARMRLATASNDARMEYQNSLSAQQFNFLTYDSTGSAVETALTPNVLYQYQPMKSQYAITNSAGQILVSAQDAKNFEESETLCDFLSKYELTKSFDEYEKEIENYNAAYNQYLVDMEQYEQYMYLGYNNLVPNLKEAFQTIVNDASEVKYYNNATLENVATGYNLYKNATESHGHVPQSIQTLLNYLLDYEGEIVDDDNNATIEKRVYTTSTGQKVTTTGDAGALSQYSKEILGNISSLILNDEYSYKCDGSDCEIDYESITFFTSSTVDKATCKMLASDFIYKYNNDDKTWTQTAEKKSLKQKLIDIYYLAISKQASAVSVAKQSLSDFVEKELANVEIEKLTLPQEPKEPSLNVDDQEKAQWYINLWYRMNGEKESAKIQAKTQEYEDGSSFTVYSVEDIAGLLKKENSTAYKVLNSSLAGSTSWIKDSLSQGIITMEKIQTNKTEPNFKMNWNGIIYSSVSEIVAKDDDKAKAIAEAKYEKVLNEIEIKDKKYLNDITRLDTEHNALKTEYDSVREEVNKNIERSFKVFQG